MSREYSEGKKRILIYIKDVTEEFKIARVALRDKYRKKALCTFSHELRTPVHSNQYKLIDRYFGVTSVNEGKNTSKRPRVANVSQNIN